VTVTLCANSSWIELCLAEYSGIDLTNLIDAQCGASGNAGAVSSGNAATTVAGDVIYGYCLGVGCAPRELASQRARTSTVIRLRTKWRVPRASTLLQVRPPTVARCRW
jgi:hypothetical protein